MENQAEFWRLSSIPKFDYLPVQLENITNRVHLSIRGMIMWRVFTRSLTVYSTYYDNKPNRWISDDWIFVNATKAHIPCCCWRNSASFILILSVPTSKVHITTTILCPLDSDFVMTDRLLFPVWKIVYGFKRLILTLMGFSNQWSFSVGTKFTWQRIEKRCTWWAVIGKPLFLNNRVGELVANLSMLPLSQITFLKTGFQATETGTTVQKRGVLNSVLELFLSICLLCPVWIARGTHALWQMSRAVSSLPMITGNAHSPSRN